MSEEIDSDEKEELTEDEIQKSRHHIRKVLPCILKFKEVGIIQINGIFIYLF